MNLQLGSVVRRANERGDKIRIHGWFLDVSTGLVEDLKYNAAYNKEMKEIYKDILLNLSSVDNDTYNHSCGHAHGAKDPCPSTSPNLGKAAGADKKLGK